MLLTIRLRLRLWLGKRLFGHVGYGLLPAGVRVSPKRWIKWCRPPELEALEFIAANTTIPVPEVYRKYSLNGLLLVELQYVEGEHISRCWEKLDLERKQSLIRELGGYIRQLRDIQPLKELLISSTLGGPCRDVRLGQSLFGPFQSIEAFHACLRGGLPSDEPAFDKAVQHCHAQQYELRYTHGDLSVLNILVHEGKIAAVIDWECSGWFPEYWEYTRAHYNVYDFPELYAMLWEQMDRYDTELKAERALWRVLDQPLDQQQG